MTSQTTSHPRPAAPPIEPGTAGPPPVPPSNHPRVPPPPPAGDTARTAAMWLGGTGVFLLTVAAAVLVALRWDDIAAWTKIAGLVTVNIAVLFGGARFRDVVPATARALRHLGALLVPLSIAAASIQVDLPWAWTLLAASGIGGLAALALDPGDEPLLRAFAVAAAVPVAAAAGAIAHVPAAIVLAAAGLAAAALRPTRGSATWWGAVVWSTLAAGAAYLIALEDPLIRVSQVMGDLGLGTAGAWWAHVAAGALATAALAITATRDEDDIAGFVAIIAGLGSVVAGVAQFGADATEGFNAVVVALAVSVVVHVLAYAFGRRRPWDFLLNGLAVLAEVGVGVATVAMLPAAFGIVHLDWDRSTSLVASAGLTVLAWFVADFRRREPDCQSLGLALITGGCWWPATIGMAAAGLVLAAGLGATTAAMAWVATGLAVAAVASGRAGGHVTAVALAGVAVASTTGELLTVVIAGLAALTLAWAGALRHSSGPAPLGSFALLAAALLTWVVGAAELGMSVLDSPAAGRVGWVLGVAALTLIVERAGTNPVLTGVGLLGRGALVAGFVPVLLGVTDQALLPALLIIGSLVIVDVLRTGDLRLAIPGALVVPATAALLLDAGGLQSGEIGIGLAALATAAIGALVALRRWTVPFGATAAVVAASALIYAAPTLGHLSTVLMILGGAIMMLGLERPWIQVFLGGTMVAIVGFWMRLGVEHIDWSEAYVAPVAALLVLLGIILGPNGTSSWLTSGAAVALLGGAAAVERVVGGPGEHALIAGVVAVVAIVAGAQRRLIGPLVLGTALVVVVAGHESLAYTASVPTWAWLALAGTVLLASGIVIERTATSPLTTGRRALQIVRTSYR